jgi:6-phosphogluconolactonase
VAAEQLLLIGSYTQSEAHVPTGCGEGIVTAALDPATGRLERRSVFRGVLNPSYLAFDAASRHVFAVSENIGGVGEVQQFELGVDGSLSSVRRQSSHGAATCHVSVLPDGRVCAASYVDGCLAVYPVRNGKLAPASRVFRYVGRGANPLRQEASHAHQAVVAPGGRWFYVCDLGADCVWRHDIAAAETPVCCPMPPGHGPRHLAFHPALPRIYVLGELTGSVIVCDWDAQTGALHLAATTRVLDEDAAAAAIRVHPSRHALWISVRKTRSLVAFRLDESGMPGASWECGDLSALSAGDLSPSNGARPTPLDSLAAERGLALATSRQSGESGGKSPLSRTLAAVAVEVPLDSGEPRDFAISPDGRWLISANQSANELVVIELDSAIGLPAGRAPQRFAVNTPVCVLFVGPI